MAWAQHAICESASTPPCLQAALVIRDRHYCSTSIAYWTQQVTSFDTHFIVMPGQRTEHVACFYTVVTHVLLSDWFILFPYFFSPLPILSSASPFSFPHPALNTFPFSGSPTCFLLFVLSFVYFHFVLIFILSSLSSSQFMNLFLFFAFSPLSHFLRFQVFAVTTVRLKYLRMWHRVVWYTSTNFSGKSAASIFKMSAVFYPEDVIIRFLQNVCTYVPHTRRHLPERTHFYTQVPRFTSFLHPQISVWLWQNWSNVNFIFT